DGAGAVALFAQHALRRIGDRAAQPEHTLARHRAAVAARGRGARHAAAAEPEPVADLATSDRADRRDTLAVHARIRAIPAPRDPCMSVHSLLNRRERKATVSFEC